jgi:hypothetical protein
VSSAEPRWIVVNRWEEFQHPDVMRSQSPAWIKVYTNLLDNPDYLGLTPPQRGVLHGLWILYARSHGHVPENTATLSRKLNVRVLKRTLEALNHAGFIHFSASRPASTEKRRLEKKVLKGTKEKSQSQDPDGSLESRPFAIPGAVANGRESDGLPDPRPFKCPQCGVGLKSERGLDDHLYNLHDVERSVSK